MHLITHFFVIVLFQFLFKLFSPQFAHLFLALFDGPRIQNPSIIKLLTGLLQFKLHFNCCTYFYSLIYFYS